MLSTTPSNVSVLLALSSKPTTLGISGKFSKSL